MTVREIPMECREQAAAECAAWGYPREIAWHEQADGYWVRCEYGIAWMVRGIRAGDWLLHGMMPPGRRAKLPRVFGALRVIAGLLGARRLYVVALSFHAEIKPRIERLTRCLLRSGHFDGRDELGIYMELGA